MSKTSQLQALENRPETYHERAQRFIKSSKSLGYAVTSEDGELIATPPKKPRAVQSQRNVNYGKAMDSAYQNASQKGTLGRGFGGIAPKTSQLKALKIKK